jgi:hypothetical protein
MLLAAFVLAGSACAQEPARPVDSGTGPALPTVATAEAAGPVHALRPMPHDDSATSPAASIELTRYQPLAVPGAPRAGYPEDTRGEYQVQLEPPGLYRLARIDSEDNLKRRIKEETKLRDPKERITFPDEPILSREKYYGRGPVWPMGHMVAEPYHVEYKRLYFEDKNSERYGWDFGPLHPLLSLGEFCYDVAALPLHMGTDPCRCFESDAAYCLPGDRVPFLIYPEEFTLTGILAEAGTVIALVAIFP